MPGLFFIRACWHGFQAEGEEGHSGAALSRVQTAARLEMGAMQTRRAGMGNNGTAEKGGEEKGTDSKPSKEKSTRRRASAAPDNIDEDMLSNVEGVTHVEEEETVSSGRGGSYSEKREGRERGKSSAFNLGTLHGVARKRSQYRINNAANNAGDSSADNSDNGINSGSGSNGIGSGIKQIEIAVRDKKGHSSASSSRHSLDFHMLRAVAVAIVGFGVIAQALAIYYLVDDIISP